MFKRDFLFTMDDLTLERKKEDERKLLLLAEHLETDPETIARKTEIKLAGWKTPSSPVRTAKVGQWWYKICTENPRRLAALENSRRDDVRKATAEVLFLTSKFKDARRVLLLAKHLQTDPETITCDTEVDIAKWHTPSSPVRTVKVGEWLYRLCKVNPRRLKALEKSRRDDVRKAIAEVLTHANA